MCSLYIEGVFFIRRLKLNRSQLVAYRLNRRIHEERERIIRGLGARVLELEQHIVALSDALKSVMDDIERV